MKGLKIAEGKPTFHKLDFDFLANMQEVHNKGDAKYAEGNWRLGIPNGLIHLCNAIIRHTVAILNGETHSVDDKCWHTSHIGVNCEILEYYMRNKELYEKCLILPKRPKPEE